MGQCDRLRFLQVSKARHAGRNVVLHDPADDFKKRADELRAAVKRRTDVEPHIDSHLIVARPSGVQLLSRFPDPVGQNRFNEAVHIFKVAFCLKGSIFYII